MKNLSIKLFFFLSIFILFLITVDNVYAYWQCNGEQCIGGRSTCDIYYPDFPYCENLTCGGEFCVGECCKWVPDEPPPPPPPEPPGCYSDSDCIDGNPCTVDYCLGNGSPGSLCIHNPSSSGNVCQRDPNTYEPVYCCSDSGSCNVDCRPAPPPPPPPPPPGGCNPGEWDVRCSSSACSSNTSECSADAYQCNNNRQWEFRWAECNPTRCGSNCGGAPPPPPPPPPPQPPGCTPISLTIAPSTVSPNSSLEFRANSSYPYQNTTINMGGGASETGFGCCDPQYTWRWFARSGNPGSYTARFSGFKPGVGTCSASASYTVSGSSCTVSWNLSNPNPPQNSFIEVRVSGQSTSVGWNNIGLYLDGAPGDYGWGGIQNPWPTFIYPNVPTRNGGAHTLQFRVNNGAVSCSPNGGFTTQSPPTCSNTTPGVNQLTGCLWDGVNFNVSDGNAPNGNSLSSPVPDNGVAIDQNWGSGGPNSFVGSDSFSGRWKGNFTFKAGTYTFYARSDDGVRLKVGGIERIDIPSGTSWRDQGYTPYSASVTFNAPTTTLVELEYYENGGDSRISLDWIYTPPPPPTSAWIQIDGDVHANERIKVPGGPP